MIYNSFYSTRKSVSLRCIVLQSLTYSYIESRLNRSRNLDKFGVLAAALLQIRNDVILRRFDTLVFRNVGWLGVTSHDTLIISGDSVSTRIKLCFAT